MTFEAVLQTFNLSFLLPAGSVPVALQSRQNILHLADPNETASRVPTASIRLDKSRPWISRPPELHRLRAQISDLQLIDGGASSFRLFVLSIQVCSVACLLGCFLHPQGAE